MGIMANQRKIPKWLPFKNYKSEALNIRWAYMGEICAYAERQAMKRVKK